jgi:hypothetical protein
MIAIIGLIKHIIIYSINKKEIFTYNSNSVSISEILSEINNLTFYIPFNNSLIFEKSRLPEKDRVISSNLSQFGNGFKLLSESINLQPYFRGLSSGSKMVSLSILKLNG